MDQIKEICSLGTHIIRLVIFNITSLIMFLYLIINNLHCFCTILALLAASQTIGWIAIKFSTDIHGSQKMYPTDFSFSATIRLTFVIFSEMSQQLLEGPA